MKAAYLGVLAHKADLAAFFKTYPLFSETVQTMFSSAIFNGELILIDEEFCHLVDAAREELPDSTVFEESWMFVEDGCVMFDKSPVLPVNVNDHNVFLHGFAWYRLSNGDYQVSVISQSFMGDGDREQFKHLEDVDWMPTPYMHFGLEPGKSVHEMIARQLAEGNDLTDDQSMTKELASTKSGFRAVIATLHLISQRVAARETHPVTRLAKSIIKRQSKVEIHDPQIKVVTLRRSAIENHQAIAHDVNWTHRWRVMGHWRLQPYKSTGEVKSIFIASYVKGPSDKPFMASNKIYVARR